MNIKDILGFHGLNEKMAHKDDQNANATILYQSSDQTVFKGEKKPQEDLSPLSFSLKPNR